MDDGVGLLVEEQLSEPVVLFGQVEVDEANGLARQFLPDANALAHGANRGEGVDFELEVDGPTAQVVNDNDVVTDVRQVQAGGPTAESISTQYENLHNCSFAQAFDS